MNPPFLGEGTVKFRVWNFGRTREIPFKGKNILLQKDFGFEISDEKLVDELRKFPYIKIEKIEDYGSMPIWELRRLASQKGLKGLTRVPKKVLIERLSEVS